MQGDGRAKVLQNRQPRRAAGREQRAWLRLGGKRGRRGGSAPKSDRRVIGSYGAVTGRVQTLSNRGSLHFTLYDLLRDKPVSCYLEPTNEEMMLGVWGKLATVEGWVSRDSESGRPLSVRHVRRVTPRPEVVPGSFREACGAIAFPPDSPSGTEIIRRQRDEPRSLYG